MNMRKLVVVAVMGAGLAGPALAGDGPEFWSCAELWQNRNQIYKDQGYCFRTPRAIRVFGNGGCRFDEINDVPLSANQRQDIRDIAFHERQKRCPR
jgi:hypothetical protein